MPVFWQMLQKRFVCAKRHLSRAAKPEGKLTSVTHFWHCRNVISVYQTFSFREGKTQHKHTHEPRYSGVRRSRQKVQVWNRMFCPLTSWQAIRMNVLVLKFALSARSTKDWTSIVSRTFYVNSNRSHSLLIVYQSK